MSIITMDKAKSLPGTIVQLTNSQTLSPSIQEKEARNAGATHKLVVQPGNYRILVAYVK